MVVDLILGKKKRITNNIMANGKKTTHKWKETEDVDGKKQVTTSVTKSTKKNSKTKQVTKVGGKTQYKTKEKWKDGQRVLSKTKHGDYKSTTRRKVKDDVYSERNRTKTKGEKASRIVTKEMSGKKSKGTDTYVTQKRKNHGDDNGRVKLGHYVGDGKGKRKEYVKESPYKMYGKESSKLEGGSPLAKYGCSKRHSPLKQEPEKTSKDLKSTKRLKAVGGEEAMAKAYTKQTGSTLYSGPLYEAFKNKYAQDRFGNV